MYFIVLFIISYLIPLVQGACVDKDVCSTCVKSTSLPFTSCRWCEVTHSCHAYGSLHNKCTKCSDSSISTHCIVTDASKCNRHRVGGLKSGDFEPYEAYNATLYSAIAYTDAPVRCANTLFPDGSFEIVAVIGRKCNYLFNYKECFAVVAVSHTMKMIILAYRGTASYKQLAEEILTILKFKVSRTSGGNVQAYFSNANDQLYPCVKSNMKKTVNRYPTYKVMIVGHSLGGAVASIASAQLSYDNIVDKGKTTLFTFGMPRPGDKAYAKSHDNLVPKSWRLVHFRDLVTRMPPMTGSSGPYHHQREIFYDEEMTPTTDYIECFEYEDIKCGNGISGSPDFKYHTEYYGVPVGSHCDNKMNRRRKRSDEDSDLSHLFTYKACKSIALSDLPTSSAKRSAAFKAMTITFNLFLIALESLRHLPY